MDTLGLKGFEALPDSAALEVVTRVEQILKDTPWTSPDMATQVAIARLEAFAYGYRLGSRPSGLEG